MLQATLVQPKKIELREVSIPQPGTGEVLIKVKAAMTCGTDLKAYLRGHSLIPMPGPFGHEYAGTVVEVGEDVEGFKSGDEVMGVHSAPCRECFYCRRGLFNLCVNIMKTKVLGAYAEYLLIPRHIVKENLFIKPEGLSFEYAALLEPLSCVVHPYNRFLISEVENALVIGAGAIGLLHTALLRSKGIYTVVADRNIERLKVAEQIGASKATSPERLDQTLKEVTDGFGFDLVVECTGQVQVWEETLRFVRRGATVILFGGCPSGTAVRYPTDRLHYDELTVIGSFHYSPKDVKEARDLLITNSLNLSPLISGTYNLSEISQVFKRLSEGEGIKYVIKTDSL